MTVTMTMTIPLRASRANLDLPIHLYCAHIHLLIPPSTPIPTSEPMPCATPVCRWFGLSVIYFNFLFFWSLVLCFFLALVACHIIAHTMAKPTPLHSPLLLVPLSSLFPGIHHIHASTDHPNLGRRARTMGPRNGGLWTGSKNTHSCDPGPGE